MGLPYRGTFGDPRPAELVHLPLPPSPMPSHQGLRPLKAWRYVGVFGPELMVCAASVRVGPARQSFWAIWDRSAGRLHERTAIGSGAVRLERGRVRIRTRDVQIDLELAEEPGVETVCPTEESYAWTRKQGGVIAAGRIAIDGVPRTFSARAVIDDTAAYYDRHTSWRWCAGTGTSTDGRLLAWNLVTGVNDPPQQSERTLWVDGRPEEAPATEIAPDLSRAGDLRFAPEATRESTENRLLVRSRYRQPFGTFSGRLPNGIDLAEGFGVMESHDAFW